MGRAFKDGFIGVSLVQAINRLQCRVPTDKHGKCDPTQIFMLQCKGQTGSNVLAALQSQMPGLRVVAWDADVETTVPVPVPSEHKLLEFLSDAPNGNYSKSIVVAGTGINVRTFERLSSKMRCGASPLVSQLAALGIHYHCATGRGNEAYFAKS